MGQNKKILSCLVFFRLKFGLILSRSVIFIKLFLCPLTMGGGGGHIVFSADPVGVASCSHSISLLNGHILAKLT